MPRPFEYTRKRFQLMQLCMCLVLITTVGVAALVDRRSSKTNYVDLNRIMRIGDVSVALPDGWDIRIDDEDHYLQATEPATSETKRMVTVRRRSAGWLDGLLSFGNPTSISFGELGRGVLSTSRPPPAHGNEGSMTHRMQLLARVNVSDGDVLEIVLDTGETSPDGKVAPDDSSLIKRIAATGRQEAEEP